MWALCSTLTLSLTNRLALQRYYGGIFFRLGEEKKITSLLVVVVNIKKKSYVRQKGIFCRYY